MDETTPRDLIDYRFLAAGRENAELAQAGHLIYRGVKGVFALLCEAGWHEKEAKQAIESLALKALIDAKNKRT